MQEEESSRRRGDAVNRIIHLTNISKEEKQEIIKKVSIWLLKVLPMIISAMYLLYTGLSLAGISFPPLRYMGGISLIPLLYIYVASFTFKFCVYHRLFLYYIFIYNIIKIANYYLAFPSSYKIVIWSDLGITGLFIFMLLYLRFKVCKN